ncbi:MAG TPA: hypothetical protein VMH78_07525 [Thermoplasmata archaeon]|nr:hypothetical protein [Thermoplasmata archaeon]
MTDRFGATTVTVGLNGSGADYTDAANDQTAFNNAVTFLGGLTPPGGRIIVQSGVYGATAEWVLTGDDIEVIFERGALIQLTGSKFTGAIVKDGGHGTFCCIFVVGAATNCILRNLRIDYAPSGSSQDGISAIMVAGGVTNLSIYDAYAHKMTRWARWNNGYYLLSDLSTEYDGGAQGVRWYSPKSESCGSNSVPDGGGTKVSNGSSAPSGDGSGYYVEDIVETSPEDLDCQFSSLDVNPGKSGFGFTCRNIDRFGGTGVFTDSGSNGCNAVFIEANWAQGSESVRVWGGRYDGQSPNNNNAGLTIGACNSEVSVIGTDFANFATGWRVIGLTGDNGNSTPERGGNITLAQLRSISCTTGGQVNLYGFQSGTTVSGLHIRDCLVDDSGAGATSTGLDLNCTPAKPVVDLHISGCDFSKVAPGGAAVNLNSSSGPSFPAARWRDVRGLTDQGIITSPLGTATVNEIRNQGTASSPTTGVAYRVALHNGTLSCTGGTKSITVTHPDGSTLGLIVNGNGPAGSPTPSANTWYVVQSSSGNVNVTSTGGSGSISIVAFDAEGNVLVNGKDSCDVDLEDGSYISWGNFSGSPSVTITGSLLTGTTSISVLGPVTSDISPAIRLLRGATVTFGSFSGATLAIAENGSSIGSPFFRYRELSVMGATGTPTSGIVYEVQTMSVAITLSGGTPAPSITLTDRYGATIASGLSTLTALRLEPGYRLTVTFTGTTPTLTVVEAPA